MRTTTFHRFRFDGPTLLRAAAMLSLAVGVGVGAAILLAPEPRPARMLSAVSDTGPLDTGRVAQWFGGAALRVHVVPHGVIALQTGEGAALISVNGAPPRAYRVGQELAPGVVLSAVSATSVTLAHDGADEVVALAKSAIAPVRGFVPVAPASTQRP